MPRAPDPGWVTPALLLRVMDGDTIEVIVLRKIKVRLLDCWAAESRTSNAEEKVIGLKAKAALQELLRDYVADPVLLERFEQAKLLTVEIPTGVDQDFADVITMGRVLGRAWMSRMKEVSALMVDMGEAYTTKPELEDALAKKGAR